MAVVVLKTLSDEELTEYEDVRDILQSPTGEYLCTLQPGDTFDPSVVVSECKHGGLIDLSGSEELGPR